MCKITVFTATYNRGYIIQNLYDSLKAQTDKDFEWLVIDDSSQDNTKALFQIWCNEDSGFPIRYIKLEKNGGKQRAINQAVRLAKGEFFFIVDSDDKLLSDAIYYIKKWIKDIVENQYIAGVSGVKATFHQEYINGIPFIEPDGYIDITNIERRKYNLTADMAEVYKTAVLKKYSFPVWEDETFTPECVVWDAIALDGYKLRFFNRIIYLCEYLDDGLTKGGYRLYMNNLMGCAMANNIKLKVSNSWKQKILLMLEIIVCCSLKRDFSYLKQTQYPFAIFLLFPFGFILSQWRKMRIKDILYK